MVKKGLRKGFITAGILSIALLTACGNNNSNSNSSNGDAAKLSGQIAIDGSSTVFPIMEAVAEEYGKEQGDVKIAVGVSGTGGGFKMFCNGEIAISNASRPIKDEEKAACDAKSIAFTEYKIAFDGLSVVVSKENDFIDHLTVEELAKIFGTESTAKTWKDVRPEWPDEKIVIFSPGADSGTFDYFNEAILDKKGLRTDDAVTLSEDDNTLVQGVSGSKYGIGYFGFAYYEENADKLNLVPVDGGSGPITPSTETIKDGTYSPLSRPLYVYVNNEEYKREEVNDFVGFFMENVPALSAEVGYIALPDEQYEEEKKKL